MKRSVGLWQLMGFAVTSFAGTLLHFLYDWSGGAVWTAPFSGVNESTWEHLKLLFVPMFLFAVVQSFFFKEVGNFWYVKLKGTVLGLVLIPVLFCTYNGVIGPSPDFINIAIFFLAAAVAYGYEAKRFSDRPASAATSAASFAALCAVGLLFFLFTFVTPHLELFRDPLTGTYGL